MMWYVAVMLVIAKQLHTKKKLQRERLIWKMRQINSEGRGDGKRESERETQRDRELRECTNIIVILILLQICFFISLNTGASSLAHINLALIPRALLLLSNTKGTRPFNICHFSSGYRSPQGDTQRRSVAWTGCWTTCGVFVCPSSVLSPSTSCCHSQQSAYPWAVCHTHWCTPGAVCSTAF